MQEEKPRAKERFDSYNAIMTGGEKEEMTPKQLKELKEIRAKVKFITENAWTMDT